MSDHSTIEWTQATWNPVTGCSKVSPGCAHCYAETFAERWRGVAGHPYEQGFDLRLWPERLELPLRWRKPRMIFVNSMSDLFHERVPDDYIAQVFAVMGGASHHTYQVLTKRPERMRDYLAGPNFALDVMAAAEELEIELPWAPRNPDDFEVFANVWLGVSIENRRYVHRADLLRATPAAVRFISAEPLLGPLGARGGMGRWMDGYEGPGLDLGGIDWLIVGGESGPRARPMRLAWARALRDVCAERGVAFFLKQLGGARAGTKLEDLPPDLRIREYPRSAVTA
ncbi:MAG: DUF5131 family protein [Solirubrobacteraceae bacterium]